MKRDDARGRRHIIMVVKAMNNGIGAASMKQSPGTGRRTPKKGSRVADARAQAQRARLESQREVRQQQQAEQTTAQTPQYKKSTRHDLQANRRKIGTLIEAYLQDHTGGNHSEKTIEWHKAALGLMRQFFEEELNLIQIEAVEADDISAWFAHLRSTPGASGKVCSEGTIQTYNGPV